MKFSLLLILLLSFPGWAKWSVSTYNIRNFDRDPDAGQTDMKELAKIIKEIKSDVMVFEEIVNENAFASMISKNLSGYEYEISDCGGFGRQKLAVAYNPSTFSLVAHTEDLSFSGSRDGCGSLRPVLLITLKHLESKTNYTFGAVHLKAGGNDRAMSQRWQQYEKLEKLSAQYTRENLILVGDFNTTGYNIKNEDFERFEDFINGSRMRTTTEAIGCTNYWTGTLGGEEYESSILDHIVVQDKNYSSVENVKVAAHCARTECRPATPAELGASFESVSDHCPIKVTFK